MWALGQIASVALAVIAVAAASVDPVAGCNERLVVAADDYLQHRERPAWLEERKWSDWSTVTGDTSAEDRRRSNAFRTKSCIENHATLPTSWIHCAVVR